MSAGSPFGPESENPPSFVSKPCCRANSSRCFFASAYPPQGDNHTPGAAPATPSGAHAYAIYRDDYVIGLLSLKQLGQIPMHSWAQTSVERAMLPIESAPSLEPSAPALGALQLILEEGVEQVAVMAEGRLLGLVTRNDLAKAGAR